MAAISTAEHIKLLNTLEKLINDVDPGELQSLEKDVASLQNYFSTYNKKLQDLRNCITEYAVLHKMIRQRLRKSAKPNRLALSCYGQGRTK